MISEPATVQFVDFVVGSPYSEWYAFDLHLLLKGMVVILRAALRMPCSEDCVVKRVKSCDGKRFRNSPDMTDLNEHDSVQVR